MQKRPPPSPPPPPSRANAAAPRETQHETHWANVADWYDTLVGDDGSEYHQRVIIPGVLRLLDLHENAKRKTQNTKPDIGDSKLETGGGGGELDTPRP